MKKEHEHRRKRRLRVEKNIIEASKEIKKVMSELYPTQESFNEAMSEWVVKYYKKLKEMENKDG